MAHGRRQSQPPKTLSEPGSLSPLSPFQTAEIIRDTIPCSSYITRSAFLTSPNAVTTITFSYFRGFKISEKLPCRQRSDAVFNLNQRD